MNRSFSFRLQKLLELRLHERNEASKIHIRLASEYATLEDQRLMFEEELRVLSSSQASYPQHNRIAVDVLRLSEVNKIADSLRDQISEIDDRLEQLGPAVEAARATLLKSEQAYEALLKLRERQLVRWNAQQDKAAQAELDATAQRLFLETPSRISL